MHLSTFVLLTEYCYGQLSDLVQLGQREFDTMKETETFFFTINYRTTLQPTRPALNNT
jgi:hypothetical protein